MPKFITAKIFQAEVAKQRYPKAENTTVQRLMNEQGEYCFAGVHTLKGYDIPALYIRLEQKASKWASNPDGTPFIPGFKFNAITSTSGDVGIECQLWYPGDRHVHLFLNPASQEMRNFLYLLANGEVIAFSFYFHNGTTVYGSYVDNNEELQTWAKRNLKLANKVAADNELMNVVDARRKMFWLGLKRRFVGEAG
jgi:hypothetical protein